MSENNAEKKTLTVKLVKSVAGTRQSHRDTVRGLGLRKVNSQRTLEDTPAVRGMINKVAYLVLVLRRKSTRSSPQRAARSRAAASAVALVRAWARPPAVATRVRRAGLVVTTRLVLKAARCRCSVACPSVVSSQRS